MYRIKCSNGKYVSKTTYGMNICYTKNGKVFNTEYIAKKNLRLCKKYAKNCLNRTDHFRAEGDLKYKLE